MKEAMAFKAAILVATTVLALGCGGNRPAPPATCDVACQDGVALRALRVGMRVYYNFAIAGNPVGMQDKTVPCIPSGSVHIVGEAQSNAMLGISTLKNLTYTFTDCQNPAPKSTTPERNYNLTINGVVTEDGTLAMGGPTTSLMINGTDVAFKGQVYDPPQDYPDKTADVLQGPCPLDALQDGNNVTGHFCGRLVDGFSGF
jgi:hypothetical protein